MSKHFAHKLTFLLFPTFPLIANFYSAHGQNNGNYEKQDAAHDSGGDGFVFYPGGYRKFDFVATLVARYGIRQHPEVVRSAAYQVLY